MWSSMMKSVGLSPIEDYVEPRLSIGNAVATQEFTIGQFKVQVDAQSMALTIKNRGGKMVWKCELL